MSGLMTDAEVNTWRDYLTRYRSGAASTKECEVTPAQLERFIARIDLERNRADEAERKLEVSNEVIRMLWERSYSHWKIVDHDGVRRITDGKGCTYGDITDPNDAVLVSAEEMVLTVLAARGALAKPKEPSE